jgi:hypothetical protein
MVSPVELFNQARRLHKKVCALFYFSQQQKSIPQLDHIRNDNNKVKQLGALCHLAYQRVRRRSKFLHF